MFRLAKRLTLWMLTLTALLLPVAALAVDNAADFKAAVANGGTIELTGSFELGETLTVANDTTINGNGHTITRADSHSGTLFKVSAGATLTLDDNLTIDGGNEWTFDNALYAADLADWENAVPASESTKYFTPETGAPVLNAYVITTSGTVNLKKVTFKNHYGTSGLVSASKGAKVVLEGAKITHNANISGSGLVVNAAGDKYSREDELVTVIMNAGTVIDGNHVGGNHGIFKIYMGTYFTMNGGEIKNTTGWNSNGTVVGIYDGVFTMNGGTICSNSSVYGPSNGRNAAIYGHKNHLFTMTGGTICHNTGRSKAGIDSPYAETGYTGQTFINGGNVLENNILGPWENADVSGGATLSITGGTFTQDVSKWLTEDCGLVQQENGLWTVANKEDIFTITYALNEGTMPDGFYPRSFVKGTDYELPNPTRNGFTFLGWTGGKYTTPTKNVKVASAPAGNVAYTANWQDNSVAMPVTGDESTLALWAFMLLMGAAGIALTRRQMGQAK